MEPIVSVVIPTYNRSALLRQRALPSVLAQTFADIECLVVDDGSTDDTERVVKEFEKEDKRVRYLRKPNGGQASARNFGIRQSRGKYIALTDDDDEFLPKFIEEAVQAFEASPKEIGYVGADTIIIDDWGFTSYYRPTFEPYWGNSVGGGCVFRREIFFDDNIFFDENIIGLEDLDMHLQVYEAGYRGLLLHKPLKRYYATLRSRETNSWSTNYSRHVENFEKFFRKNSERYANLGREAESWLYFFGGMTYARAGSIGQGKKFLLRALKTKLTANRLLYYLASLGGRRFFGLYDRAKLKAMRVVRSVSKFFHPAYWKHYAHRA